MDSSFSRVKSIIDRLREVLKCQKCFQMKQEDSMLFFHVCDHFYCVYCMGDDKTCPLCKNPLDKPTNVVNDKNILSLYNSLAKFELPSKRDIEEIYRSHKNFKEEKLNKNVEKNKIQETPKNEHKSRLNLRNNKSNVTSPNETGTIVISSGDGETETTPKRVDITKESVQSKNGKKTVAPGSRGRSFATITTPDTRKSCRTPIMTSGDVASVLISAGGSKPNIPLNKANINKRNPKGETQLHVACKKANFTVMTELIAAGANPNAQDNAGWTPLHDSVFSGNIDVIKFLLDNGAKVNTPGLENTTALHEAIAKGNIKIVKLLLEYGADINAMNIFKETPLDLVNKYKLEEMKEAFTEASKNSSMITFETEESDQELILYKYFLPVEDEKLVNKFIEKFGGNFVPSLASPTLPSHIIIANEKIELTWALVSSVLKGCWIVTTNWVKDSMIESSPKPAADYVPSSPSFSGFIKARSNKLNRLPGLFSGCHFFFGGNFETYTVKSLTIGKEDLKSLVDKNGGVILKRCPDPESLALEKTIPFHAPATSSLGETSYFIIYQAEKWDPKPKYNMSHMKTLPIDWLVCCILKCELIDPNDKEKSWTNLL